MYNIPHHLFNSLQSMAAKWRASNQTSPLKHHGLITLICREYFLQIGGEAAWQAFLKGKEEAAEADTVPVFSINRVEAVPTAHIQDEPSICQPHAESSTRPSRKRSRVASPQVSISLQSDFVIANLPTTLDVSYGLLLTRVQELEGKTEQLEHENQILRAQYAEMEQKNKKLVAANDTLRQQQMGTQTLHVMIKHITAEQIALKDRIQQNFDCMTALTEEKASTARLREEIEELRYQIAQEQYAFSDLDTVHTQLVAEHQSLQDKYEEAQSRVAALSQTFAVPRQLVQDASSIFEEILRLRSPSSVYSVYLKELFYRWQLSQIKKGRPYCLDTPKHFLQEYSVASEEQRFLMCECFIHGFFVPSDRGFFVNLYVGEVQLRAFISALLNQIQWRKEIAQFQNNQEKDVFPMRIEAYFPQRFRAALRALLLQAPIKTQYKAAISQCVQECSETLHTMFDEAVVCCNTRWMGLHYELRVREVFTPDNLYWSRQRALSLISLLERDPDNWVGSQFRPPLILFPVPDENENGPQSNAAFRTWESRLIRQHGGGTSVPQVQQGTIDIRTRQRLQLAGGPYDLAHLVHAPSVVTDNDSSSDSD